MDAGANEGARERDEGRQGGGASRGMWQGRRGQAKGCDANTPARDEQFHELLSHVEELRALLRKTEAAIDLAGEVLSLSQPARVSGKYGLRWWRVTKLARYLEPVLVRWIRQKNGRMTPKPVERISGKLPWASDINAEQVRACLGMLSDLMDRRRHIKRVLDAMSKSLRNVPGWHYHLDGQVEQLIQLRAKSIQNLLDAGYEVEGRYLDDA